MDESCGNCKHFESVGYKNWGKCAAPVPMWVWECDDAPSDIVWTDGSNCDLAKDCEMYEPREENERCS